MIILRTRPCYVWVVLVLAGGPAVSTTYSGPQAPRLALQSREEEEAQAELQCRL